MSNYLSAQELNSIQGLLVYLNNNLAPIDAGFSLEAKLTDSNGDPLATVKYNSEPDAMYVLECTCMDTEYSVQTPTSSQPGIRHIPKPR